MDTCTAYAISTECGEIKIEKSKALAWQLWFIDTLANLLEQSQNPKVVVSLFQPKEIPSIGVNIVPLEISDLAQTESRKPFLFRLELTTAETTTDKAYGQIINLVTICINVIETIRKRNNLTLTVKLGIINSNTAVLFLNIIKTV